MTREQIARWIALLAFVAAVVFALASCGPTTYGVTFDDPHDARQLAEALSEDLAEWDAVVGVRPHVRYVLEGDDYLTSTDSGGTELGECRRVGSWYEVSIDLDAIQMDPHPRERFRQVLFHELTHVCLTCTNADHVPGDKTDLMYPHAVGENLHALPSAAELRAIHAVAGY